MQARPSSNNYENNLKVYWSTPLGESLKEAMQELNIKGDLHDLISEKFEKSMDQEFEKLGAKESPNNPQGTNPWRHKLQGTCKYYNNVFNVCVFSVKKFSIHLESGTRIVDVPCMFKAVPHGDYQMKA